MVILFFFGLHKSDTMQLKDRPIKGKTQCHRNEQHCKKSDQ